MPSASQLEQTQALEVQIQTLEAKVQKLQVKNDKLKRKVEEPNEHTLEKHTFHVEQLESKHALQLLEKDAQISSLDGQAKTLLG